MEDILKMTLCEVSSALESQSVTSQQVVEATLSQMNETRALNAFIHEHDAQALLDQAKQVDQARQQGQSLGPLAGVPIALKDNLCTTDMPTTAGSRILGDYRSAYDATVVARLREAGVLFVGKTNLDEFAMGSSNEHSAFGRVLNPNHEDRIPGGSSGGSASAVAAHACFGALGSDTGGSIRQPAAHCGIVGFKPTYGRVSRFGLIAFASSLDQIGPMTRSVPDAAMLFDVIGGHDPMDMTSAQTPLTSTLDALGQTSLEGIRVGLPTEYIHHDGLSAEVANAFQDAVEHVKSLGATVEEVSLPHTDYAISTYYLIATAEASSNLARFDGVRYGHRTESPEALEALYERSRAEGFGPEVKRRIMLGTFVLSAGFYDAYYLKAQRARTLIRQDFERAFEAVDVLLTPTTPSTAFAFGAKSDPLQMYLEDIYTISCNLAGVPGISIPWGADNDGLPIGVQLMAPIFEDARLLSVADTMASTQQGGRS